MFERIKDKFRQFFLMVKYFKDVRSIARRMFITNTFDSIFASIGVAIGGYKGAVNPVLLGMSILGGGLTMGFFSSFLAVYLSERTERLNELKRLEKELMISLKDSIYGKSIGTISFYISLWSSFGSIIFTFFISLPYFLLGIFGLKIFISFIASLSIALTELIYLGYYMSRVSNEKAVTTISRNVALGVLAILFMLAIKLLMLK
ncbi:MAG: hypothetical protein F7B61_02305 [Caldisphaeraceae archaeon]|nr:hypothetical protein [Caldisphaeraceae archaeon]